MTLGCASPDAPNNSRYAKRGVALMLLVVAFFVAACGGSHSSSDKAAGANAQDRQQAALLRFAQCMRGHGVDYPDPKPDGTLSFSGRLGPQANAAIKTCSKNMPAPPPKTPAQRKRTSDAMLALTKCLRAHGADVDDPETDASGDTTFTGRGAVPPAAQRACKPLAAKAGVRLPPQ